MRLTQTRAVHGGPTGWARLRLFLALSRTPHSLLDMATPALGALIWLGAFPPPGVIVLGLITAFAGYTAVYALNDVIDYRTDKERIQRGWLKETGEDLDAVLVRHPLARDLLTLKEGLLWVVAWAMLAMVGAYALNPFCLLIFLIGFALETVYCLLLRISHFRTIVSGAVKTSGGIAAVYAVDPNPSSLFILVLFLWLFFWEIGGQNIPNDLADMEGDRQLDARTVPNRLGPGKATTIIIVSLVMTLALNIILFQLTHASFRFTYVGACLLVGLYFLIMPACRLFKNRSSVSAEVLFNRASYYPLALLVVVAIRILI